MLSFQKKKVLSSNLVRPTTNKTTTTTGTTTTTAAVATPAATTTSTTTTTATSSRICPSKLRIVISILLCVILVPFVSVYVMESRREALFGSPFSFSSSSSSSSYFSSGNMEALLSYELKNIFNQQIELQLKSPSIQSSIQSQSQSQSQSQLPMAMQRLNQRQIQLSHKQENNNHNHIHNYNNNKNNNSNNNNNNSNSNSNSNSKSNNKSNININWSLTNTSLSYGFNITNWKFPFRSHPKKIMLVYGQNCCVAAKKRACAYALEKGGFDQCLALDQSYISTEFQSQHKDILKYRKGAGYWLWKPYIILHTLLNDTLMQEGDILVYMDAGAYVHKPLDDMYNFLNASEENINKYKGVLFFGVGLVQKKWCKRDAFILQHCDESKCWDKGQINAMMNIWIKSSFSIYLSQMWLNECRIPQILTDSKSVLGENLYGYRSHRHDQAIITNIMNRENFSYGPSGWDLRKYIVHDRRIR